LSFEIGGEGSVVLDFPQLAAGTKIGNDDVEIGGAIGRRRAGGKQNAYAGKALTSYQKNIVQIF